MSMFEQVKRWVWGAGVTIVAAAVLGCTLLPVEFYRFGGGASWLQTPTKAWAQAPQQIAKSPSDDLPDGHFGELIIALPNGKKQTLQTHKLHVSVTLQGKVARTQVEQVFYNPTSRQTEGTYTFHLPDGAAISRLAMSVNGKLVEGELVERTKARAIYNSIVRKMKDPALLEWQGGNRFRTQIFPIPARGTKRVILSYDHILETKPGKVTYVYHLPRVGKGPKVKDFRFSLAFAGHHKASVLPYDATVTKQAKGTSVEYKTKNFRSRGDIVVKVGQPLDKGILHAGIVAKKTYGLLALPLKLLGDGTTYKDRILIVDTSAGIGRKGLAKARLVVKQLLRTLPSGGRFGLVVGDVQPRFFKSSLSPVATSAAALAYLGRQVPRGATDLKALLLAGLKLAKKRADVIYIGDGHASLGEMDASLMMASLKKEMGDRQLRISSVAIGRGPEMGLLRRIARESAGRALRLQVGQKPEAVANSLQAALSQPVLSHITYKVVGMSGTLRARKGVVANGETLLLAGQMTAAAIRVQIQGKINGKKPFSFKGVYEPAAAVSKAIAPAFWARWTIEALQEKGIEKRRIIKLSKQFGVMSRYTSYLVLENDKAYKKHQITRRKHNKRGKKTRVAKEYRLKAPSKVAGKGKRKDAIRQWMRPGAGAAGGRAPGAGDDASPSDQESGRDSFRGGNPGLLNARPLNKLRRSRRSPRPQQAPVPSAAPEPPSIVAKPRPARRTAQKPSSHLGKNSYGGSRHIPAAIRRRNQRKQLQVYKKRVAKQPMHWHHRRALVGQLMMMRKYKEALTALQDWRRYAPDHASLIIQEAALLKRLGQQAESRRVLSEIVEFTPHAYQRRALYARELARLGNITKACEQYTQAVRLNPAKRTSFRTMMSLYRSRQRNKEYRNIIRDCIVKGVSRLPVVRDISMVLFWDDPSADIDLHIHEPSGEEVYYRKRESKQGGTLYYDITNGLGPEIYVLGTGKKGTYKVSAVLYRGSPKVITATLVVLRHAGSPKETRKTYKIKLYKRNGRKPVKITTIKLK